MWKGPEIQVREEHVIQHISKWRCTFYFKEKWGVLCQQPPREFSVEAASSTCKQESVVVFSGYGPPWTWWHLFLLSTSAVDFAGSFKEQTEIWARGDLLPSLVSQCHYNLDCFSISMLLRAACFSSAHNAICKLHLEWSTLLNVLLTFNLIFIVAF